MTRQTCTSVKIDQDVFATPRNTFEAVVLQLFDELINGWISNRSIPKHINFGDDRAWQLKLQTSANGLDFWEFRHSGNPLREEKCDSQNKVYGQQLHSFQPVALTICGNKRKNDHGDHNGKNFEFSET